MVLPGLDTRIPTRLGTLGCHISQFLLRTFVPCCLSTGWGSASLSSQGPEEEVADKIQLKEATQGPGQETHRLCREHLPRGSSPREPLLLSSLPTGIQAGQSLALDVQVEAGSWRLLLVHWRRFGLGHRWFVARGVCQGRVVLPVAQVGERQAHG